LPITGFANSVVSPAMEYKREGFVLGVAARMFQVAGPVIVYGSLSALLVSILRDCTCSSRLPGAVG
jgi:stage V sporulation protein AC